MVLLWVHMVGLYVFGLVRGYAPLHLALETTVVAGCAVAAMRVTSRTMQSTLGTLGLVTCSALLVHLSGGTIEAHFHFFIVVGVVTLYQSWLPFVLAMVFVVVHHTTVGIIDPRAVYDHQSAINKPWLWAGIHALFVTGAALAGLRSWKYAEVERDHAEEAAAELRERSVRHQEAVVINDTIVQGLVAARYSAQLGEVGEAEHAIERTLLLAQKLVASLMATDDELFEPGGLRHLAPDPARIAL